MLAFNHKLFTTLDWDNERFSLIVLDDDGRTNWIRDLDPFGRTDLFQDPHVSWNESLNQAAVALDVSGAGTYLASLQDRTGARRLRLVDDVDSTSWCGVPRWLDNRLLFCPIMLNTMYHVDSYTQRSVATNRLTIYDAKTGILRTVYESPKMVSAVASNHYLAIEEEAAEGSRIVITTWKKDAQGRIVSPMYVADDAPRDYDGSLDWTRLIDASLPPLKFEPGKHAAVSIDR